jgi:glutamate synthase (NADPH/NADH) large chain
MCARCDSGDANDYVGKGLSGGIIAVRRWPLAARKPGNTIIGNTVPLWRDQQAGCSRRGRRASASPCAIPARGGGRRLRRQWLRIHDGRHGGDPGQAVGDNFGAGMTGGMAFV